MTKFSSRHTDRIYGREADGNLIELPQPLVTAFDLAEDEPPETTAYRSTHLTFESERYVTVLRPSPPHSDNSRRSISWRMRIWLDQQLRQEDALEDPETPEHPEPGCCCDCKDFRENVMLIALPVGTALLSPFYGIYLAYLFFHHTLPAAWRRIRQLSQWLAERYPRIPWEECWEILKLVFFLLALPFLCLSLVLWQGLELAWDFVREKAPVAWQFIRNFPDWFRTRWRQARRLSQDQGDPYAHGRH